jgi:hypothetical protein
MFLPNVPGATFIPESRVVIIRSLAHTFQAGFLLILVYLAQKCKVIKQYRF